MEGKKKTTQTMRKEMPRKLKKSLKFYVSKIKKKAPHLHISPSSLSATTSKILSGCKHPKSLSFSADWTRHQRTRQRCNQDVVDDQDSTKAATLEDIDRFLHENFKSLYGEDDDNDHENDGHAHHRDHHGMNKFNDDESEDEDHERNNKDRAKKGARIPLDSPRFYSLPKDSYGPRRFFVSSSSSGSLAEEARVSEDGAFTTTTTNNSSTTNTMSSPEVTLPGEDCIVVLMTSENPYERFRQSMVEMIEARTRRDEAVDWEYIEDLLFCYLRLNDKRQYKYILGAFVDLVMVLRENDDHI
ncbi:hypothetical protein Droror1_Dr00009948 [Drosera rotundifolia]